MKRRMPRVVPAVLMAAAAAFPANAADWGQLATISSTLGVNANRLCVGEGLRSDIGCPTYAPYLDANGSVGIGRQPSYFFDVSSSVTYALQIAGPNALYMDITNGTGKMRSQVVNSNGYLGMMNAGDLAFNTSGIERVRITANGNVGISTTNPNAKLEVNGDISATNLRLSGNLYVSGSQTFDGVTFANGGVSATGIVTATSFSGDGSRLTGLASGDRITSGTSSIIVSDSAAVTIRTNGADRLTVNSTGNVGIGTNAPKSLMDIGATSNGLLRLRSTASITWANFADSIGSAVLGYEPSTFGAFLRGLDGAGNGTLVSIYGSSFAVRNNSGSEKLTVASSGNVGIGTTSPQTTLQVSGSFTVSTSAQTTTPTLSVGTNGGIGIGTAASAVYKVLQDGGIMRLQNTGRLEIDSQNDQALQIVNGATTFFKVDTQAAGGAGSYFPSSNVGIGTTTPSATLHVSGTARITSWTAIAANVTPTTELDVYGTISATNILVNGAPITGTADRITSGTTSAIANTNGSISFTTAGTERVVITTAGNFGVGTSSPNSGLHVARAITSTGTSPLATFENTNSGSADQVRLSLIRGYDTGTGTNRGAVVFASNGIAGWADYENRALTFWTSASSVASEKMRIGANGNVGIGTTSPGKTLDVSGTAQIVSRTLVGGTGTPSATLQVSGSLLLAGNDNIPCTTSALGLVRRNPTTGRLQACR